MARYLNYRHERRFLLSHFLHLHAEASPCRLLECTRAKPRKSTPSILRQCKVIFSKILSKLCWHNSNVPTYLGNVSVSELVPTWLIQLALTRSSFCIWSTWHLCKGAREFHSQFFSPEIGSCCRPSACCSGYLVLRLQYSRLPFMMLSCIWNSSSITLESQATSGWGATERHNPARCN